MAIVKWDPWREIEDMFDRYTRAGGVPAYGGQNGDTQSERPSARHDFLNTSAP